MQIHFKQILLIISFSLLFCLDSFGQEKSSFRTVHGSVRLQSGASVRDAGVRLLDSERGTSTSAAIDRAGSFTLSNISTGQYRLQVSISGVLVYDEPLPQSALSGESVDVRLTDEKALADVALLHPEETVDVTATRQTEDLLTSASSVSVVTRAELEARNVQTLDEGLDQVPGLYVQRIQGLADTEAATYLRGFNGPNRTLVLLDGQPINDSFFGDVPWNVIPVDEVQSVEVVRGPFSSLYGGNALGGVINIRTRRPTHRTFDLGEEYGSNATDRVLAHYADSIGKLGVVVGYERLKFGGYENAPITAFLSPGTGVPVTGATLTTDPYGDPVALVGTGGRNWLKQNTYRVAGEYAFDNATSLEMQYIRESYSFGHGAYSTFLSDPSGSPVDNGTFQVSTPNGVQAFSVNPASYLQDPGAQQTNFLNASLAHAWKGDRVLRVDAGYNQIPSSNFTAPDFTATLTGGTGTYTNINADNLHTNVQYFQTLQKHMLTFGDEVRHDEAKDANYSLANWLQPSTKGQQTYLSYGQSVNEALYAQDEFTPTPRLRVIAGGRYEYWKTYSGIINNYTPDSPLMSYPDRSDQFLSGKIGASYSLPGGVVLRGSLGNAFRNPDIFELYATSIEGGITYAANPNLQSEHVWSWEAGLRKSFSRGLNLDIDYFQNNITNLIYTEVDLAIDPTGNYLLNVNAGHGRTSGVEISLQQKLLSWLSFRPSYTWTQAIITSNPADPASEDKYIPNIPKQMIAGALIGTRNRLSGAITARYAGATFETNENIDTIRGVPGAYDPFFLLSANLNFRIDKHFEVAGTGDNLLDRKYYQFYLTPGRQIYAGIHFRY